MEFNGALISFPCCRFKEVRILAKYPTISFLSNSVLPGSPESCPAGFLCASVGFSLHLIQSIKFSCRNHWEISYLGVGIFLENLWIKESNFSVFPAGERGLLGIKQRRILQLPNFLSNIPCRRLPWNAIGARDGWSKGNITEPGTPSGDRGVFTAARFSTPSFGKPEITTPNSPWLKVREPKQKGEGNDQSEIRRNFGTPTDRRSFWSHKGHPKLGDPLFPGWVAPDHDWKREFWLSFCQSFPSWIPRKEMGLRTSWCFIAIENIAMPNRQFLVRRWIGYREIKPKILL